MANVDIKVNLITKAAELQLQQLGRTAATTSAAFTKFGGNVKGFGADFDTAFRQGSLALGRFGTIIRAGVVGAGLFGLIGTVRKTVTEFADFEKALVGIGKVADVDGAVLQDLGNQFQQLALRVPLSTNELINLGEEAARLGIRGTQNLLKFSEVAARLAVSTNVSGAEAVTALTRIINVTGDSVDNIDRLGSALVELGNNFATSEADILEGARVLTQRTAGFGLAAKDILAISTALKDAGAPSESSASAIQTFFTIVSREAVKGGQRFRDFADIVGLTEEELKKKLAEDALGTLQLFVQGLSNTEKAGGSVIAALDKLGLAEKRTSGAFRTLVANNDRFVQSINLTNEAFDKNLALNEESDKAFKTVAASIQTLQNAFTQIFTNIGQANSGVIRDFISGLTTIISLVNRALNPQTSLADQLKNANTELKSLESEQQKLNDQIKFYKDTYGQIPENIASGLNLTIKEAELNGQILAQRKLIAELEKNINSEKEKGLEISNRQQESGATQQIEEVQTTNLKLLEAQAQFQLAQLELYKAGKLSLSLEDQLRLIEEENNIQLRLQAEQAAAAASIKNEEERQAKLAQIGAEAVKREANYVKAKADAERLANQQKLQATSQLFGSLASLTALGGKKSFAATKALLKGEAVIAGYLAVQRALASAPPPFNYVAAAAVGIQTAANVARINAQQPPAFQDGGVVPGNSMSGDRVLARVNSGEMILNRQQQAQLFAQANGRGTSGTSESVTNITVELDGDVVAKAVSRRVNDGTELGSLI